MAKGTVKWFDPKKGFGFVLNEAGEDVFVHYTSIIGEDGFRCLRNGQVVEYEELRSDKGLQGRDIRIQGVDDGPRRSTETVEISG
ncbi:MAG: cold-shock protein [Anaerohalosphaera sp.]|nr:cold-shock protein [Anaerohalosphaera sp.]